MDLRHRVFRLNATGSHFCHNAGSRCRDSCLKCPALLYSMSHVITIVRCTKTSRILARVRDLTFKIVSGFIILL